METVKLYQQDAFLQTFSAQVLRCEAQGKNWQIVLDQTAFYPEGGGQPADQGAITGANTTVRVLDVHERGAEIHHLCDGPLPVGQTVTGQVDWARRFDHMQQHSGEHIVSGLICGTYHCDNVGFHLGADSVIIDFNTELTWEQVLQIEAAANRYVWEDHTLEVLYPDAAQLAQLPYRSKKELEGQVRITHFPGADMCACCGTHVAHSGQVGLVKFLSCQKFREGVRLELLCGGRAHRYLSQSWEQNRQVGQLLSVQHHNTYEAVCRLHQELQNTKLRVAQLEESWFQVIAQQHQDAGDVLLIQPEMSSDSLRRLCDAVAQTCGGRCAAFSGENGRYKYAIIHPSHDIRELVKELNTTLQGRGGGRDGFAQGSIQTTEEEIRAFFEHI
ncbi:MAG: alanyl-tRNA editing protein [Ruminococcaceae bacterium]|nr:alanyl-tRNA editing protein [Oscillospiraceae bacterium]